MGHANGLPFTPYFCGSFIPKAVFHARMSAFINDDILLFISRTLSVNVDAEKRLRRRWAKYGQKASAVSRASVGEVFPGGSFGV
jgi:hypothetical protein